MRFIKFLSVLIFVLLLDKKVFASDYLAPKVFVRIESYNKTILKNEVTAYTFRSAIEKSAASAEINIIYSQTGQAAVINSIDGIKNNRFNDDDQWFGYIKRNNMILNPDDYLNQSLKNNDEIVLYYGKKDYTQIASDITLTNDQGAVSFFVKGIYSENNKIIDKPSSNIKIHLISPDNQRKILITNNSGKAITTLSKLGVYTYTIHDSVSNSIPNVVKSDADYFFYGATDSESVTRAEAVAFLVNQLRLKQGTRHLEFADVNELHHLYNEIKTAVSINLISGYGDGTFKPDDNINLLQMSIMLSNILPEGSSENIIYDSRLPVWAVTSVSNVVQAGLLSGIDVSFEKNISTDDLINIYINMLASDSIILNAA